MKSYPPRTAFWYDPERQTPRPVFGIDIDGTLGEYHDHFLNFAESWLGKEFPRPYDGSVNLAKWMGISKTTYRKVKLGYRRGGLKRSMPVYDGARDLVVALRKRGAVVVLCTTRPYLSLENIDEDTREWARRNGIQHDRILWGEHKYRDLKSVYGSRRIVAVMDDLPSLLSQATGLGMDAILRRNHHNARHRLVGNEVEVHGLSEAKDLMLTMLDKWEGRNR